MRFDYSNGWALQHSKYSEYIDGGKDFSVEDVLTSQALSYKMIEFGEQYGWHHFEELSKAFEDDISGRFTFHRDGVSDVEQSTYVVAALGVAFQQDFRQDFADLNFPIDDTLYQQIFPEIENYVYGGKDIAAPGNHFTAWVTTDRDSYGVQRATTAFPSRMSTSALSNSVYLPFVTRAFSWCSLH
jgi:hypothetical protein